MGFMRRAFNAIKKTYSIISKLDKRLNFIQEAIGRVEFRQLSQISSSNLQENEFKVYSQWGEDGIIQKLLRHVKIENKIFIEFGVENYTESNTRFLLVNNNWSGLVIDGSQENIDYIKKDSIYWQHNLKAECCFITRENINSIFSNNGIKGEIGILSIDIDGNDYWVWEAIDSVNPAIVIVEYNARFGSDLAVSIPYFSNFVRSSASHSMVYYGASLKAFYMLAKSKGYAFVGCNSAGNNAFFVRRDLMVSDLVELTVSEGFIKNQFRESRDATGNLMYLSEEQEIETLKTLSVVNVEPYFQLDMLKDE